MRRLKNQLTMAPAEMAIRNTPNCVRNQLSNVERLPAPDAALEEPAADHGPSSDDEQEPGGEGGAVGQVPNLLPHQDACD